MILKKPYGFLIKHFRLIHLLITGILVYIVRFSTNIYKYINSCIDDQVNRYNALEYIDFNIYIFLGIVLLLFGIIFWLFKYKDKPRNVYVLSILGYVIIGIYLFVLFNYFSDLSNMVIDQKVIRAYRDIMLMVLGFQYIITIIMFVRGLGFDVKKFNFTKDIQELNITNEDGEEVEVDVNVNTNAIMRGVRKQKRELGYFFNEYKIIILGILAIVGIILVYFGYNYIQKRFKVYNQGELIGSVYNINIKNSYFNIDNDNNYVIISFDVMKYGVEEKLNINNLILEIGNEQYLPNKNICSLFDDLGNCYKKQYITNNTGNYIISYEVDSLNLEKAYLVYRENYDNSFKVKLNLENYE